MNDAEYEALREELHQHVLRWRRRMGLGQWTIHEDYDRAGQQFHVQEHTAVPYGPMGSVAARTFASWQYLEASLIFNMPALATCDPEEREYGVVHELGHVLVAELHGDDDAGGGAHEERVVTTLARALLFTYAEGRADGGPGGTAPAAG